MPDDEPLAAPEPTTASARSNVRRWLGAAPLAALGLFLSSVSLGYPFGRDQGLYYYVGREWFQQGALPYRDLMEHKAPGIYVLYGLLVAIFGEGMWPIRLVDWLATIPCGLAIAALATRRGQPTSPRLAGFAIFVTNVFYFGFFDYWSSAQCEIWCSHLSVFALWLLLRSSLRRIVAVLLAGLLAGIAVLIKPPCAPLFAVVALAIVVTAAKWRRAVAELFAFGAAGSAVGAVCVAYFAAKGGLADFIDVLVRVNGYYVKHERGVQDVSALIDGLLFAHHMFDPIATTMSITLCALTWKAWSSKATEERIRFFLPFALTLGGAVGVISQLKLYPYHWGLIIAGEVLAATVAMSLLAENDALARFRRSRRVLAVVAPLALFALNHDAPLRWLTSTTTTLGYLSGSVDREAFYDIARAPHMFYYFKDSDAVGRWLRAHAAPGDRVLVRGFQAEIYAASGMRYGGRFFWDAFLVDPRRLYRRDEFLAQDRADIERIKPRWVVCFWQREGWPQPAEIQSVPWFEKLGYRRVETLYSFVIMERIPDAP
jgi:hypothetical protein